MKKILILTAGFGEGEDVAANNVRDAIERLAPEGARVTCRARVIHVDGPTVTFQVDAHDEVEPIARGIHRRRRS